MNRNTGADIDQRDIDALLVDFINYVGMRRGVDFGMYAVDLNAVPNASGKPTTEAAKPL